MYNSFLVETSPFKRLGFTVSYLKYKRMNKLTTTGLNKLNYL